jgi:hypothetical protein
MLKWLSGRGHAGSVTQVRVPDLTVNTPQGPLVVDLKFTRSDGTVDGWRTQPGKGNGRTQPEDYRDINRQTDPDSKEIKLDPDDCNCDQRGAEPVRVYEPVPAYGQQFFFMPLPAPGPLPALPPLPAPMPAPIPAPVP